MCFENLALLKRGIKLKSSLSKQSRRGAGRQLCFRASAASGSLGERQGAAVTRGVG